MNFKLINLMSMNFKSINLKLVVLFNALHSFLCLWNFIVKKNSSILLLTFGRKNTLLTHCKPVIDRPFAATTFLYSRWKYNTKRFTNYLNMLHENIKYSSVSSVDIKISRENNEFVISVYGYPSRTDQFSEGQFSRTFIVPLNDLWRCYNRQNIINIKKNKQANKRLKNGEEKKKSATMGTNDIKNFLLWKTKVRWV